MPWFRIGMGMPTPTAMDMPYPVMSRPRTNLLSICFMSPMSASVLAPATGTPSTSSTLVLYWVPGHVTYPSPPPKNILVPMPMVSRWGSFRRGDSWPAELNEAFFILGRSLPM